ncbi:MAG: transposase [Candidatus Nealsonbacteria bacterium]
MPIKRPPLVNNEIYHIVIRGVGGIPTFKDKDDYYRGIFSLYEFNNSEHVEIRRKREQRKASKARGEQFSADARKTLLEILAFYLMPNHIHLLVKQIQDNGITQFMRKLGAGYAAYFNKRYGRMGHLFQGRFKAVHIENDEQLMAVFAYIHTNGVSLIEPNWKEKGIESPEKVIKFLEDYKWSSYPDYIGKKNFPSITKRDFLLKMMNGEGGCKEIIENRIRDKEKKDFNNVELE